MLMENILFNITVNKSIVCDQYLLTIKLERVKLIGGLQFVSQDYFTFMQRLEFVFIPLLKKDNLIVIGPDLITNVYNELSTNSFVILSIVSFIDLTNVKKLEIKDLVKHTTQMYCRMRGKGFIRKFMQKGFKTKNLGKGIRNQVGVMSNPNIRKSLKSECKKTDNNQRNFTGVTEDKTSHRAINYYRRHVRTSL